MRSKVTVVLLGLKTLTYEDVNFVSWQSQPDGNMTIEIHYNKNDTAVVTHVTRFERVYEEEES